MIRQVPALTLPVDASMIVQNSPSVQVGTFIDVHTAQFNTGPATAKTNVTLTVKGNTSVIANNSNGADAVTSDGQIQYSTAGSGGPWTTLATLSCTATDNLSSSTPVTASATGIESVSLGTVTPSNVWIRTHGRVIDDSNAITVDTSEGHAHVDSWSLSWDAPGAVLGPI